MILRILEMIRILRILGKTMVDFSLVLVFARNLFLFCFTIQYLYLLHKQAKKNCYFNFSLSLALFRHFPSDQLIDFNYCSIPFTLLLTTVILFILHVGLLLLGLLTVLIVVRYSILLIIRHPVCFLRHCLRLGFLLIPQNPHLLLMSPLPRHPHPFPPPNLLLRDY